MRRLSIILLALTMSAVACSGGGASGRKVQADRGDGGSSSPSPTAPGSTANPSLTPTAIATATKGLPARGNTLPPDLPKNYKPPTGYAIPNLFTAAENTIGITSNSITLCMHAPLNLAAVFKVNKDDLNVYWKYVNEQLGGIYGRTVNMYYADDKYGATPADVQTAYASCRTDHGQPPFMLFSGFGVDQIPQVRTYADRDHQLYVHTLAREDFSKKYSFSFMPSVETFGRRAAQWVLHQHLGQKIGIMYRNSENWEPGHRTFKAELAAHGVTAKPDLPVDKNATVYSTQIKAMKDANVKVAFLWENALAAIEVIKQADQQDFHPLWLVFPFNLMTDTLDAATVQPVPAEGIAAWPAYRPGDTSGTYSSYANEIKFFESTHHTYSKHPTDDITWMTWLGWRQIHRLLLDCGRDCTRNKIVGLMQANLVKPVLGDCSFDFKANGHVGGFDVNIFQAYLKNGNGSWKNLALCKRAF